MACSCAFWNVTALCRAPANRSARVRRRRTSSSANSQGLRRFHVEHAEQAFRVNDRESDGGRRAGEDRGRRIRADFRDGDDLAGARYLAYQSFTQENAATERVATRAGFGLDLEFLGGVFENGDADVIVGERVFDFGGDLGEHFFGIQSGDGVAGDIVDQCELLGFSLLFGEEAGVFDGDGGFAGEDAQQLDVAFIESAFLRAVDGHHADGLVVQN